MPIYEIPVPGVPGFVERLRPMNSKDTEISCLCCGSGVKRMVLRHSPRGQQSRRGRLPPKSGGEEAAPAEATAVAAGTTKLNLNKQKSHPRPVG